MFVFGKFDVLCFLETPVLRFALRPVIRPIIFSRKSNNGQNSTQRVLLAEF